MLDAVKDKTVRDPLKALMQDNHSRDWNAGVDACIEVINGYSFAILEGTVLPSELEEALLQLKKNKGEF